MGQNWAGHCCQNFENYLQKCVTLFKGRHEETALALFPYCERAGGVLLSCQSTRISSSSVRKLGKGVKGKRIKGGAERRWIGM
jgi:hypothetical protein